MKVPVIPFLIGLASWCLAIAALILLRLFRETIIVIGLGANAIGIVSMTLLILYRPPHLRVKYERVPISVGSFIASGSLFVFAGLSDLAIYVEFVLMAIGVLTLRLSLEKTAKAEL